MATRWGTILAMVGLLLMLATLADQQCPPQQLAQYQAVFTTYWTKELFPKHYPQWRPHPQWTKMLGVSHSDDFVVFREGERSSPGLRKFVEEGRSDLLEAGIYASQGEKVLDTFYAPAVPAGAGTTQATFFAGGAHARVSIVAKIVPSPDWFVGVDSLQLCSAGHWINTSSIQLPPMDAGTDQGLSFTSPSWVLSPPDPITMITNVRPRHPAASFAYPNKSALPTIATLSITKIREYRMVDPHTKMQPKTDAIMSSSDHMNQITNALQDVPIDLLNNHPTDTKTERTQDEFHSRQVKHNNDGTSDTAQEPKSETTNDKSLEQNVLHAQYKDSQRRHTLLTNTIPLANTNSNEIHYNNILPNSGYHLGAIRNPPWEVKWQELQREEEEQRIQKEQQQKLHKQRQQQVQQQEQPEQQQQAQKQLEEKNEQENQQQQLQSEKEQHQPQQHQHYGQGRLDHLKRRRLYELKKRRLNEKRKRKEREREGTTDVRSEGNGEVKEPGLTARERLYTLPKNLKLIPKGDAMSVIDNIVETYQRDQRQKRRERRRQERRQQRYLRRRGGLGRRRGAVDCVVGDWSSWSSCSKTCGIGEQQRRRQVTQQRRRGGNKCPVLTETTWCGSAKACHGDRFIW